jgi:hypothetical protein
MEQNDFTTFKGYRLTIAGMGNGISVFQTRPNIVYY